MVIAITAITINAQEYVDLGLPSGTKWCDTNAGRYVYDEAIKFNAYHILPSKAQWNELKSSCTWTWNGNGYRVTGPNGRSIFLPTTNFIPCPGKKESTRADKLGLYWTSAPKTSNYAWYFGISENDISICSFDCCAALAVRLVLEP